LQLLGEDAQLSHALLLSEINNSPVRFDGLSSNMVRAALACLLATALQAAPTFAPVKGILEKTCIRCHSGETPKANLDLTTSPKNPNKILAMVTAGKMPLGGPRLTEAEVKAFKTWIDAGAQWEGPALAAKKQFWAFRTPVKTVPPAGETNPIDAFLKQKLRSKQLDFSPTASPRTLIRRLSFDLTGLPPSKDDYSLTYEQAAAKYLASPQYGERWGRHWLDVVRFGETDGGEHNFERPNAWPYRDYVIRSLNDDLSYKDFIREQIAGDLLAPNDPQKVAATGFLVAGPWDQVQAEINKDKAMAMTQRMDELDDMVTTTFHTFQAMTVNCARCHDHKFDPIPTRDYYSLTAVFAGVGFGNRRIADDKVVTVYEAKVKPLRDELAKAKSNLAAIEDPKRIKLQRERYQAYDREHESDLLRMPLNAIWNRNHFAETTATKYRLVITSHRGKKARIENLIFEPAGIKLASYVSERAASDAEPLIIDIQGSGKVSEFTWATDWKSGTNDGTIGVYKLEAADGSNWRTIATSLDHARSVEIALPTVTAGELTNLLTAREREAREPVKQEITKLEAAIAAIPEPTKLYAAVPKSSITPSFVLERGSVSQPRDSVGAGAMTAVKQVSLEVPQAASDRDRRLALADWIASDQNPLTARVLVNRVWYLHFGTGLVNTPSDFGVNGDRPSHPELLDWLAVSFMENGWSLKWLHRTILASHAYQQTNAQVAKAFAIDADNRLYWRMPLKRMDAETIRDSVLFHGGNLDLQSRGGPGFALQKKGDGGSYIYKALSNDGPAVWKRAVYRFSVRGGERIMMDSFDCPDPAVATPQRSISNTPVQALTLLNNEFILSQSGAIARRVEREASSAVDLQIKQLYDLLFGRQPSNKELTLGQAFIKTNNLALYARALLNTNEFLYVP
jgi:mono/diheme cytochrome c family protein/microcompartment protein CcmK/EutM